MPVVLSLLRYQKTPITAVTMKMIFRMLRILSLLMFRFYLLLSSVWNLLKMKSLRSMVFLRNFEERG